MKLLDIVGSRFDRQLGPPELDTEDSFDRPLCEELGIGLNLCKDPFQGLSGGWFLSDDRSIYTRLFATHFSV